VSKLSELLLQQRIDNYVKVTKFPRSLKFFVGLHHPNDAIRFERAFVSVRRIDKRKSLIPIQQAILDSGAYTIIDTHGGFPDTPKVYAAIIRHQAQPGLLAAVSQDYMCEPHMLKKTGKTIRQHQELTIQRYDDLCACDTKGVYILPVLQGYAPKDYVRHIDMYGDRLAGNAWVGVGSVCKRNGDPAAIEDVLWAILAHREDLRLHGFGIKTTALGSPIVRDLLYSADSMAWSFAARRDGRGPDANKWQEAKKFVDKIELLLSDESVCYEAYDRVAQRWNASQ
jgi:hypothetical protein